MSDVQLDYDYYIANAPEKLVQAWSDVYRAVRASKKTKLLHQFFPARARTESSYFANCFQSLVDTMMPVFLLEILTDPMTYQNEASLRGQAEEPPWQLSNAAVGWLFPPTN